MGFEEYLWKLLDQRSIPVVIEGNRCFLVVRFTFDSIVARMAPENRFVRESLLRSGFENLAVSLIGDKRSLYVVTPFYDFHPSALPFYPEYGRLWESMVEKLHEDQSKAARPHTPES